jgi:hypothetical protein
MSERSLASVQVVREIIPIPGRDRIELARVEGWKVIVQKGLYTEGSILVYFEVDSVLPPDPRWNADLERYKFRVKTMKMAGEVSQGYTMPLSNLTKEEVSKAKLAAKSFALKPGTDLTAALKVTKYEPDQWNREAGKPIKKSWLSMFKSKQFRTNPYRRPFPSFIPRTDETRVEKLYSKLEANQGIDVYLTEKIDGSSMTVYLNGDHFGVCSRNLELLKELPEVPKLKRLAMKLGMYKQERLFRENSEGPINTHFWQLALRDNLEKKLRNTRRNLALQGEIIGPGIQQNRYGLEATQYHLFNLWDIDEKRYLDYHEMVVVCQKLNMVQVPFIGWRKLNFSVDDLVQMADGKSSLNNQTLREGLVVRSEDMSLSFKVISPKWLIKTAA